MPIQNAGDVARAGEIIDFTCTKTPAWLHGREYQPGDVVRIELAEDWDSGEGLGEGGPWGWGGYSTETLEQLGRVVD